MNVQWFYGEDENLGKKEIALIEGWIEDHAEEIHEIYHLVQEYEMEAVKIIDAQQERIRGGGLKLTSYDLYILSNTVMVIKSEETQSIDNMETNRKMTFLGELEIPCDHEREDE